jgi:hypothetical protein
MDSNTREPVEYEIPLLGKLKTNYPAILFVVLGFSLLAYNLSITGKVLKQIPVTGKAPKTIWKVEGRLISGPESKQVDLSKFFIDVHPSSIETFPSPGGAYMINILLDTGKKFEDEIQRIKFTGDNWSAEINPHVPYYKDSLIELEDESFRKFKPLKINISE